MGNFELAVVIPESPDFCERPSVGPHGGPRGATGLRISRIATIYDVGIPPAI
jgi:hypothetical protein